jgi:hypothetical protein
VSTGGDCNSGSQPNHNRWRRALLVIPIQRCIAISGHFSKCWSCIACHSAIQPPVCAGWHGILAFASCLSFCVYFFDWSNHQWLPYHYPHIVFNPTSVPGHNRTCWCCHERNPNLYCRWSQFQWSVECIYWHIELDTDERPSSTCFRSGCNHFAACATCLAI